MKLELDKTLELPLSADLAWTMLQDIEAVAACLPGAKITERVDDTHYKGAVTVKLGPATVAFKGTIEIASKEPVERRMRLIGKGSDAGNTSAASLELLAWIEPNGTGSSILSGHSEVSVTGKVAAFGARLMTSVSDVLIKQFFDNMLARARTIEAAHQIEALPQKGAFPAASVPASVASSIAGPVTATAPSAAKLNLVSFAWAVVKDYLHNLFGRTKAT